jgi:hypothetical protein
MAQRRRQFLATAGTVLGGSLAGCVGFLTGDEALEFSATKASVAQSARDDTGYEENKIEDVEFERTFEVGGQERTVKATNWHSEYDRAVEIEGFDRFRGAMFAILTTPKVELDIADKTLNPVGDKSHKELTEMVQSRYEGLDTVTGVGEYSANVLGNQSTVGEYEGEVTFAETGQAVDLALHVTDPIDHGDDFVVCIGAYPDYPAVSEMEFDNVQTLFDGVEHE